MTRETLAAIDELVVSSIASAIGHALSSRIDPFVQQHAETQEQLAQARAELAAVERELPPVVVGDTPEGLPLAARVAMTRDRLFGAEQSLGAAALPTARLHGNRADSQQDQQTEQQEKQMSNELNAKNDETPDAPRSLAVFQQGVQTSNDFATAMSALMTDVITGAVTPQVANAVCNAGGKMLKVVEMQHRWGRRTPERDGAQVLQLADKQ